MAKKTIKNKVVSEDKLISNMSKVLEQFMNGRGYEPLTQSELFSRLTFSQEHRPIFRQVLKQLKDDGILGIKGQRYYLLSRHQDVVTGVIRTHPRGFGFLQPDENPLFSQEIFIPKQQMNQAVDGDTVEVAVNPNVTHERGPDGRVVSILKRGRTHLAGSILRVSRDGKLIQAYVPLLGLSHAVYVIPSEERELKEGDRIIMKVTEWSQSDGDETLAELSHYIGHIDDPTVDTPAAIEEYALREVFPTNVLDSIKTLGTKVSVKEMQGREDLRELECFTIDPDTAKDFDDALSLSIDDQGIFHLGVHIADVSYYVQDKSAVDKEASLRCNSTYFPGYVVPMLPHELSSHLCSLKPNVNRLAASILMRFSRQGELLGYDVVRSVIRSKKRFTYTEAKEVLDGKKKSPLKGTLDQMVALALLFKKQRYARGSIEFSLPELIVKINPKGLPTGIERIEYDITHQLVEEFMLKANELVATHLGGEGISLPYRIHEEPGVEDIREFAVKARSFGFNLQANPTVSDLQHLFDNAKGSPFEQQLAISFIKSMRLAYYSPDNIGHYGLSLPNYCHFTSPIRRYVDLVVHRILFGKEDKPEYLHSIANQCSTQERISARAEGAVSLLKKLRYLKILCSDNPDRIFDGIITKVKPFGIFFEVTEVMLEGFTHVSELDSDYLCYIESHQILEGERTGVKFACGHKVEVSLKNMNFITLETEWQVNRRHKKASKRTKKKHKSR